MFDSLLQDTSDRIVQYLVEADPLVEPAHLLNLNISGLRLVLDPGEDDLPTAAHKATLRYWRGLTAIDGVPDQLKVDPDCLQSALGYLMLVDVLEDPAGFRYALYGTKIANISGFDMTGKTVWEIDTQKDIQVFFAASYMAVMALRRPLFTAHEAPPAITTSLWNRLILPLGDEGTIKRFLVCNVPIQDGVPV